MQDQNPQTNPKKLFVGNLPYSFTEDQLREHFSQFGEIVDVKLIIDRMTGRSKGIAFVEYQTEAEAQKAIDANQHQEFDGRTIIVNVARPPRPRTDRSFGPRSNSDYGPRRDRFDRRSRD